MCDLRNHQLTPSGLDMISILSVERYIGMVIEIEIVEVMARLCA